MRGNNKVLNLETDTYHTINQHRLSQASNEYLNLIFEKADSLGNQSNQPITYKKNKVHPGAYGNQNGNDIVSSGTEPDTEMLYYILLPFLINFLVELLS